MLELSIPLNNYLQEYFIGRYDGEVFADAKSVIGVVVQEFLQYTPKGHVPIFEKGDHMLNVKVRHTSNNVNARGNVFISDVDNKKIYRLLSAHFKESFFSFMDGFVEGHGMKIGVFKKGISAFCKMNNLTEDRINFDLLTKSYYRQRQRNNICQVFKKKSIKSLHKTVRPILT